MAYGFSVFWLPLSRAIGITQSAPDDWKVSTLGWMYTLFFVFLGSSAALVRSVGRAGRAAQGRSGCGLLLGRQLLPRRRSASTSIRSGCCGSASGVIGGCGLGLGYISPVSTLIKWFPDRRGMATGLAIMGFGGGAMIGTPLADRLMRLFRGARLGRRLANLRRLRRAVLRRDDGRGVRLPHSTARLVSGGARRRRDRVRRRQSAAVTCRWRSRGRRASSGCCGRCCV